ncbi:MAG: exonuclease domain-containing protein [Promethearchaeota archaeon]
MKYCVIDLECTCWEHGDPNRQKHEIIEIGAVLLDENYNYVKEFTQFVKPFDNPILTKYCTDLTSITQADIESAPPLREVISQLEKWMGSSKDVVFCSWGDFDKNQLFDECALNLIEYPFDDNHINIKTLFSKIMRRKKRIGLQKALRIVGIQFEGTPHRAIFDAKMTAKVFKIIMEKSEK